MILSLFFGKSLHVIRLNLYRRQFDFQIQGGFAMKLILSLFLSLLLCGMMGCSEELENKLTGPQNSDGISDGQSGREGGKCGGDHPFRTVDISGIVSVGILLVEFQNTPPGYQFTPDNEATILQYMFDDTPGEASVHNLYQEMSFEVDGFTGGIVGTFQIGIDNTDDCGNRFQWNRAAMDTALAHGVSLDYDVLMYIYSEDNTCIGNPDGHAFSPSINPIVIPEVGIYNWSMTPATHAHELGHLRGFNHSGVPPNWEYGDYSCVMGDNRNYDPGCGYKLPMRQVNAVWKYEAGYFRSEDVPDMLTTPGTYTVYLAPTQRPWENITHPPAGQAYHLVKVKPPEQQVTYYLSFRRAADSNFDNHWKFADYMDRAHVRTKAGHTWRQAMLLAGESFEGNNFAVTAITDGLGGDEYVELSVTIYDKLAPDLSINPSSHVTNNQSPGIAPETYMLTITNVDPIENGPTTFDLTGTGEPGIFEVEFIEDQVIVYPGASEEVMVYLNFDVTPPEQYFNFSITVTDPVGPRTPASIGATYINDLTPPSVPADLAGAADDLSAILTWTESTGFPVGYDVRRDGNVIGSTELTTYTDTDLEPNTTYEYQVRSVDQVGNESDWCPPVYVSTECSNGFLTEFAPLVIYRNVPFTRPPSGALATYTLTIENFDGPSCAPTVYATSTTVSDNDYVVGAPVQITVNGGESVDEPIPLTFFTIPPSTPIECMVSFTITIDDPDPNNEPQVIAGEWIYDITDPTQPTGLSATMTDVDEVTLTWTGSIDGLSGVAHYEIERNGDYIGIGYTTTYIDSVDTFQNLRYRVRAFDHAGNYSAWSNSAKSGCPKCPRPNNP
jgi:hypothetical protein